MSAHTPGPWELTTRVDSGGWSRPVVTRGSELVCAVSRFNDDRDTADANARLIAAAPDMYAALKFLRAQPGAMALVYDGTDRTVSEVIDEALSKAEGKS